LRNLVEGARGEWTLTPGEDITIIRWADEFNPLRGRGFLLRRIVVPLWRTYMAERVDASARAAERIYEVG